jgi:hypothetical protein
VVEGYKEIPSSNIVYGEAVHRYRHIMYQTKGHIPSARDECVRVFNQPKIDKPKSPHMSDQSHMLCTAFNFWEMYVKKDTDLDMIELTQDCWKCRGNGVISTDNPADFIDCPVCKGSKTIVGPATELSFSLPYYKDEYIDVSLCGTLDGLGKIKGGCYIIPDLKTTSSWDKKGYFGTYTLSRQFRMYRLALKLMSEREPESILGQIGKTNVGCLIDAIFIKPAPNDNTYARSEVMYITDKELNDFQKTLDEKIAELSAAVRFSYFPKQGILNGSCEGKWGRCMFWNVCKSPDEIAKILLERDFKKVKFNPLNYSGI